MKPTLRLVGAGVAPADPTEEQVLERLRQVKSTINAAGIAAGLGLAESTVKAALELLARKGKAAPYGYPDGVFYAAITAPDRR